MIPVKKEVLKAILVEWEGSRGNNGSSTINTLCVTSIHLSYKDELSSDDNNSFINYMSLYLMFNNGLLAPMYKFQPRVEWLKREIRKRHYSTDPKKLKALKKSGLKYKAYIGNNIYIQDSDCD